MRSNLYPNAPWVAITRIQHRDHFGQFQEAWPQDVLQNLTKHHRIYTLYCIVYCGLAEEGGLFCFFAFVLESSWITSFVKYKQNTLYAVPFRR